MSRFFANTVKVALCLGLAALLALGLTQAEQPAKAADLPDTLTVGQWTESEDNPVYDSEAKAYYPSVLFDGTTYRMWYAGNSGIFYTESADGVNWVSGTAVTGLVLTANHPHVEYCGDKYIMWYQDTTESKLYSIEAIRYAESTDGTTWENDQAITGNIISGVAGQWNGGSYGAIDVFYNPSASGTGTYPFDYSYAMYYDATTGGLESIGLGYSTDGITWELYGEVLPTGNDGTWDSDYATFGTIIKESDNSWHMWYSGGQSKSNEGIGHAYSTDGLTWTRDIANPILHKNDEIEWRNGRTYTPAVIKIGDEYKMWFSCADSSDISKIGYMTSKGTFSTIQSAIDAAVSGTTINVKNGVYNESIVIDVPNLTITGEDTATTIVDAQGSDIAVYIQKNLENFYIHGFTIQNWNIGGIVQPMSQRDNTASHVSNNIVKPRAAGPTLHGNSIQVSGDYSDVIGNEVQVTGYDLTESEDAPTGILVIGADNTAIRDNHVYYIEGGNLKECKGIAVGGSAKNGWEISTGNTIDHNIVEGVTHGIVVWASTVNTEITNNTVRNNEAGFYSQTRYDNEIPYGTQIHHNSIINNGFGILSENEIVDATKNWWGTTIKSEITANISGSVSYDPYYDSETMDNCIRNKNIYNTTRDIGYDTIQDAVDDVGTGDTITVADGTYAGAVVTRPVILRPEDGALVTIDTGPLFATGLRAGFYFPDTSGSGTTIEGFRFAGTQQMKRSAKDDDNKLDIAIYSTDADDITITDCIITDTLQAITNWHGDRWLIDNVRITNLWCLNGGGIGILIGARNGSSVHHNIVRNTTIEGTMSTSDEEKGGYDGQGITLYSDFRSGKSGGTITDTLITGNVIGMTSDNPGLVNFNGLELSDTREADAVSLTITGNIITNNTFHDNSGDGITVSRGAANNSFRENAVNGNNSFGIINTGPDALLARANWWGTADGAGVAAVISGNVQYDPYYDSETMDNLVSHKKVYNTTQDIGYDTIQSAVDEADAGDSINVAAGNYQENLVVNKSISIIGTSAGSNPTVFLKPVSDTPVISIRASGMSAGNPLLLKNLHITTDNSTRQQDGKMTGIMITNPGNTLSNIKLDTITVIGNNHPYDDNNIPPVKTYGGLESGVKINKDTSVNTLEITQCFFKDLSYGFMCGESTSDNPQTLEYCVISNSRFEHNSMKGIYIERLSFSEFSDLIVVDNGITTLSPDWADKYNSGIDINLKFGNYENITFTNLTVTGNGIGSADGTGLTIKARGTGNDSDSYKVKPATLTNVTVNGGTFDGNTIGIRIGERDKNNTSPTNVTLSNIDIKKTNESGGLINCLSGVTLNAVNNWWDSPDGPEHTGNTYNIDNQGVIAVGDIDFAPWFRTAAGTGFSPVTNGENGYPSLQSAIDAASPGDTLQAAPGMFTERIVISKPLTLLGSTHTINKNGYVVPADYAWDTTVETVITNPEPALAVSNIVDIVSDDVIFKGFIVQSINALQQSTNDHLIRLNATTGKAHDGASSDNSLDNIIIQNNIIGPNTNGTPGIQDGTAGRMGLYFASPRYPDDETGITNTVVSGNKIFDCLGNGNDVFVWGSAKSYNSPANADYTGTVIEDNEICGAHRSGIEISGGVSNLTIRNNNIHHNPSSPSGETSTQKYGNGIAVIRIGGDYKNADAMGVTNLTITGNRIHDNEKNGIYMGPLNNNHTITDNKLYNNGWDAIRLDLTELYDGRDTNFAIYDAADNIDVSKNFFEGNAAYGIQIIGTPTNGFILDATRNWWGTSDETEIASMVAGAVVFDPWHLKQLTVPAVPAEKTAASSVILTWTAEGTWDGDYLDFRYATSPIVTNADWNKATRITGEPAPAEGKEQQMIVRGLKENTKYYFALSIGYQNTNSTFCTIEVTTKAKNQVEADITPPGAVTGLSAAAGNPATTRINLSWTATGDDGTTGFAKKYIIKRSSSVIDEDNFADATEIYNNMNPKVSGKTETFTVTNLVPGAQYWFAVQAVDEAGNKSVITVTGPLSTINELPVISGITPPAETHNGEARQITITGSNLNAGTPIVRLVKGSEVIRLTGVTEVTAASLKATIPAGVPEGVYKIRVINNNGTSKLSDVSYEVTKAPEPMPVVTNVAPNLAASNTEKPGVKITGEHFTGVTGVKINGTDAVTFIIENDTLIIVTAPALPAGEYDIQVTTPSGTNDVSSVKYIVTDPFTIDETTTEDTTTSTVIETTGTIPVQVTLTTDNDETATKNVDVNAEISVVIPPATSITSGGAAYSGTINPPRVVKPDTTVHTDLPDTAVVIEMGNPDQTINFDQDFVTTVRVESATEPDIYYFNKTTGKYELAGKNGEKDGTVYVPGGTVLVVENLNGTSLYTIGLLMDHMSTYVASSENLLPPSQPPSSYTPPAEEPALPKGTTDIRSFVSFEGRFYRTVTIAPDDAGITLAIPAGTVGLTSDLEPLENISMVESKDVPEPPQDRSIVGIAWNLGPDGAVFDPSVNLTVPYNPAQLPDGTAEEDLIIAWYDETAGEWQLLETTVDTVQRTATAKISHFTTFALLGNQPPAGKEETPTTLPEEESPAGLPDETTVEGDTADGHTEPASVEPDDKATQPSEQVAKKDIGIAWYWWLLLGVSSIVLIFAGFMQWRKYRY